MFVAPVVSALTLAISAHGLADARPIVHRLRHVVYALAGLTGLGGTALHVYNIRKRPGGFSWLNLFYGAPLGAPGAIALAGLLGYAGERVRGIPAGPGADLFGLPAGRMLAGLTSGGLLAVTGEVWLLHFRGAFQNPVMFAPVILPPASAILLATPPSAPRAWTGGSTRRALRATALLGFAGDGLSRLRHLAPDGRLAELEPEHSERPTAAGTAQLHRPGAGRPRRSRPDGGSSRCLRAGCTATPATTCSPSGEAPSWNDATRRVIDARLAIEDRPRFLDARRNGRRCRRSASGLSRSLRTGRPYRWQRWSTTSCAATTATAIATRSCLACARPGSGDCARSTRKRAWRTGPASSRSAETRRTRCSARRSRATCAIRPGSGMPSDVFFDARLLRDIVHAYYSHPTAWSEIGFGGPASPRGYVRMDFDRRDPLGGGGGEGRRRGGGAEEEPACRMIRSRPRAAKDGRAPDVFREGGWIPMREYRDDGRGGLRPSSAPAPAAARWRAGWRKPGFRSWRWMPAPSGGRWRTSPRTRWSRTSSTGPTNGFAMARTRCSSAATTAASRWAAAPFTSPWSRCASALSGSRRAACWATAPTGRSTGGRCGTTTGRWSRR